MKFIKDLVKIAITFFTHAKSVKGFYVIIHQSTLKGGSHKFHNKVLLQRSILNGNVIVNKNSRIINALLMGSNQVGENSTVANSSIGEFTYVGNHNAINNTQIGKFCSIGPGFSCGLGQHPTNFVSTSPLFYSSHNSLNVSIATKTSFEEYKPITIGNDVWIGANVFINEGIVIGDGAIIGAGAIVTKDVDAYAIVGGIPAKLIKHRFAKDIIDQLKTCKWWEHDLQWIKKHIDVFNKPLTTEMLNRLM